MSSGYPSGLTASAFEALIHYFYTPVDLHDALDVGTAGYKAINELRQAGLIEGAPESKHGCWRLTAPGEVMARHILETPLPIQVWAMPRLPATVTAKP